VAGKTGTALKVADGDYSKDRARASFVGFFPADRPSVALLVIIGEPETSIYGGQVAAPVFRRIARRWADTFPRVTDRLARAADSAATPEPPASSAPLAPAPDRLAEASGDAMPDLRGVSARRAVYWLRRHGVAVRLRGGEGVVTRQVPAPGADLPGRAVLRCATPPRAGAR
jgi:cell division protein FtsI (penicillin-binding protein 3)